MIPVTSDEMPRRGSLSGGHRPFWPPRGRRFRWLPRHGEPVSTAEAVAQRAVKAMVFLPVYTAIVVTLMLVIQIWVIR